MKRLVVSILAGAIIAAGAVVVFANPFGVGGHDTGQIKLEAELEPPVVPDVVPAGEDDTDAELASGEMKWEERLEGDPPVLERRRWSTEIEDAPEGDFVVNVTRPTDPDPTLVVGTMTIGVDALGNEEDLDLDTRNGDTVPMLAAGDLVEVLSPDPDGDGPLGPVVILTGTLEAKS